MRPQQTTKRAGQGEPTSRPPSPEDPGALLYTAEPYTYHEATWLGGVNVGGRRGTLDVLQDDLSERHEMLDAFDAAFEHAPKGADEWETMMRAAGAVRDVNEWYGRSIGRKGRRL